MSVYNYSLEFTTLSVNYNKQRITIRGNNELINEGIYLFMGAGFVLVLAPILFPSGNNQAPYFLIPIGSLFLLTSLGYVYNRFQERIHWVIDKRKNIIKQKTDDKKNYLFDKVLGLELYGRKVNYLSRSAFKQSVYSLSLLTTDGKVDFISTSNYEVILEIANHMENLIGWKIINKRNITS